MKTLCEKPRLRRLLDHFSAVTDPREQWRVANMEQARWGSLA